MFARALGWDKSNVTWYLRGQTSDKNLQIRVIKVELFHSHKKDDDFKFCVVIARCEDIYGNFCIQEIKKQLLPPIICHNRQ